MTPVSDGRRELISRGTRREIRDLMNGTVLRGIEAMWQDEGFAPGPDRTPLSGASA